MEEIARNGDTGQITSREPKIWNAMSLACSPVDLDSTCLNLATWIFDRIKVVYDLCEALLRSPAEGLCIEKIYANSGPRFPA